MKSSNLRHSLTSSQNEGLHEYQRRASWLWSSPSLPPNPLPEAERQARDNQSQKARGNLGPRDGIFHQIVSRLKVAIQVFLGFWMVDIHQEGCSQRSAPQRRHTAHVRWCSGGATRKPRGWDQGGD